MNLQFRPDTTAEAEPANRPARWQRNVTGLWREMRVMAIYRLPQKMGDHRVAHIFRAARAFAPKSQHIALSPRWVGGGAENMRRSTLYTRLPPHQRRHSLRGADLAVQQRHHGSGNRHLNAENLRALHHGAGTVNAFCDMAQ